MARTHDADERASAIWPPRQWALALIRGYKRWLSPWLAPRCRFYPTCSEYAYQVIDSYGLLHGGWLAFKRLLKCHPLHPGGIDLPPRPPRS